MFQAVSHQCIDELDFKVILSLKIKILIQTIHLAIADASDQEFGWPSVKYFYVLFCKTI